MVLTSDRIVPPNGIFVSNITKPYNVPERLDCKNSKQKAPAYVSAQLVGSNKLGACGVVEDAIAMHD